MRAPAASSRVTFGLYEADLQSGELWKGGFRVKLQSQPFKVLAMLLQRPGQLVTREELQIRLWGRDTIVDFDHSLGTAINKIREALGDSADNPRFVETLARRGYRFIAPVHLPPGQEPDAEDGLHPEVAYRTEIEQSSPARPPFPPSTNSLHLETAALPSRALREPDPGPAGDVQAPALRLPGHAMLPIDAASQGRLWVRWATALAALLLAALGGYYAGSARGPLGPPHITQITRTGNLAPSVDTTETLAEPATDGVHLFAATLNRGHDGLSAIALSGGSAVPLSVPEEISGPMLADISPDGSRLLLRDHLSPESEQPLWVVPATGGSALRVGDVRAHDATWMPDGEGILYAAGNALYLTHLNSSRPQLYTALPGRGFWLRWEPKGRLLRFTIIDPIAHTPSLWQISDKDRTPRRVLATTAVPATACCGVWTADGHAFVFQSSEGGNPDLWELSGEATRRAIRLTDGPLQFQSPVAARTGNRIFFLGVDARSDLEQVEANGQLAPVNGFLSSAIRVDYSRDGRWVAWTDEKGGLWRARSDGTEKLQLTPDGFDVFLAHWSPDASRLAIMAREPGRAWQIYLLGANGGDLQPVLREQRNAADPSWSPDGQALVFGRVNDMMGKENAARTLHILHLATNQLELVPGSDGLFSPRWSPDGRYIAALSLDQRQVRLYTLATHTWTTLLVPSGADPVWSSDSRSLFLHASLDPAQPIDRVSIPEGHVDEVVRLADSRANDAVDFVFGGLTSDNRPLIRSRVYTGNVYAMDLR